MPELWQRCPKARYRTEQEPGVLNPHWYCECHGFENDTLVPFDFDAAVERMMDAALRPDWRQAFTTRHIKAYRTWFGRALRAAMGKEQK